MAGCSSSSRQQLVAAGVTVPPSAASPAGWLAIVEPAQVGRAPSMIGGSLCNHKQLTFTNVALAYQPP